MICQRPGFLRDYRDTLQQELADVNVNILRLCVTEGLTLDEAVALAREGA
jgi:hypothetical protein